MSETSISQRALRGATLYDADEVGSHTIELWMDAESYNDEARRWHWLVVDGDRPMRYKNRDLAAQAWRAQVEAWAFEVGAQVSRQDYDNLETWQ